jgi:ABC-2 type transport system permease protein
VIIGKYLSSVAMVLILLGLTLLYPLMMFAGMPWHLGTLDWGPVWSGYLGCSFFAFAAVAIGMMLSSLTESDVIAFFTTAGTLCFLYAIGLMVSLQSWGGFWGTLGDAAAFISFQTRLQSFMRGIIDTRAVVYFLSVTIVCLLVASRSLESRKWS